MDNNSSTLKKSIEAGKWVFYDTLAQKALGFASLIILARLLTPKDFGTLAILLIIPNFFHLITATGVETALIHKKEDPKPYLNTLWTFNIIKSLIFSILIFIFAPFITKFFNIESALWALRLSGVLVILPAFANVGQIYFSKDINFKKIFIRNIIHSSSYAMTATILAVYYKSFWPLFVGSIVQEFSFMVTTYFLHPFRPNINFEFRKLLDMFDYSKWIYGQNLISRVLPIAENSFIARMIDSFGVGLFTKAKNLAGVPIAPFYNIFTRVTFPAYARIQDSYEKIRDGFLKSLDVIFFITIPISLLILTGSRKIILIIMGQGWVEMDPLLKILVFAVILSTISATVFPILNAIGKPKTQFKIGVLNILILVTCLYLLIPTYGTKGAAIGSLITSLIVSFTSLTKIMKILNIKLMNIIKLVFVPLFSSLTILYVGRLIFGESQNLNNKSFVVVVILFSTTYLTLNFLSGKYLKLGPYSVIKLILRELK